MIIDRRSFIQSATLVGSSIAVAGVFSGSSNALALAPAHTGSGDHDNVKPVVFSIAGWNLDTRNVGGVEVVFQLNQSWRTAWR